MNKNDYNLNEHKHRFACWAASRAASVKGNRFTVQQGKSILDSLMDKKFPEQLNCQTFDEFHERTRNEIIELAREMYGLELTHGVSAKLINIYHKTMFICDGSVSKDITKFIHPPIDSLLLDTLSRNFIGDLQLKFKAAKKVCWTKFSSNDYQNVINAIKEIVGDQSLWAIESYWRGYL